MRSSASFPTSRGSPVLAALQRLWDERLGGLRERRVLGALRFTLIALLAAPVTYLANRAALRHADRGEVPRGCTSACMEITVREMRLYCRDRVRAEGGKDA